MLSPGAPHAVTFSWSVGEAHGQEHSPLPGW